MFYMVILNLVSRCDYAVMKALLLAGGSGTRLRPITHTRNKHMIPIANRPLLFYALDNLKAAGIRDVGIIIGPHGEKIPETIKDGVPWGLKVRYLSQPTPKGIADTIVVAQNFLGDDSFVFHLGDILIEGGIQRYVQEFNRLSCDCMMAMNRVEDPRKGGVIEYDDEGNILRLTEKPEKPKTDVVFAGVCVLRNSIHKAVEQIVPSSRHELELSDAVQVLVDTGKDVRGEMVTGWWQDAGSKPEDLLLANQIVLRSIVSKGHRNLPNGVSPSGEIVIGEGTTVLPGSKLSGPLIIGDNCIIGPNSFIGPNTSIGNNSIISDSDIQNSILMDNVTIKRNQLYDSIVGTGSKVLSSIVTPKTKLILGDDSQLEI